MRNKSLKIYLSIVTLCFLAWAIYMQQNQLYSLFKDNWFMSVTMIFGSFVAGATSEGGGAVAFPVMTLFFKISPSIARDFSLMIQSFGMTMAALTIVLFKIKIRKDIVLWGSLGGLIGISLGLTCLDGVLPPAYVKMFFTSLWLAFAFHLFKISKSQEKTEKVAGSKKSTLLLIGLFGGLISSIVGTGIDILFFSYLTLAKNESVKISTPTSVVLMGINSLVGFIFKQNFITNGMAPDAWNYLYCCIPVVIIGAPMGALFIKEKSKNFIQNFLIISLVLQFIYSIFIIPQTIQLIAFSLITFVIGMSLFYIMKRYHTK